MTDKQKALMREPKSLDPFALLRTLTGDFDRVFTGMGWPAFRNGGKTEVGWWPQLDVVEKNNALVATVDLPGVNKEDVKIEFVDGQLTIGGERKREFEDKKENVYRCEREVGSFFRTIPLPDGVKPEQVKATFTNGVLEVMIPLPAAAPPVQKIPIAEAPAQAA